MLAKPIGVRLTQLDSLNRSVSSLRFQTFTQVSWKSPAIAMALLSLILVYASREKIRSYSVNFNSAQATLLQRLVFNCLWSMGLTHKGSPASAPNVEETLVEEKFLDLNAMQACLERALGHLKNLAAVLKSNGGIEQDSLDHLSESLTKTKSLHYPLEKPINQENLLQWKLVLDEFFNLKTKLTLDENSANSKNTTTDAYWQILANLSKEFDQILPILAEAFYLSGDKINAISIITKIVHATKIKEAFIAKVAECYFNFFSRDPDKTLETINLIIHDTKTKEALIAKVAEHYYDFPSRDLDKALKTINLIIHDTKTKEAFITKVAEHYYHFIPLDLDKALKRINLIIHDTKTKEAFIAKVAEHYFNLSPCDLDKALNTISLIVHDTKTKEAFIAKVAEEYYTLRDRDKFSKTIKMIVHDKETKNAFRLKLVHL